MQTVPCLLPVITSVYVYYAPFKEEGAYCFANVGRSVGRSVRPLVDQMVSNHYLYYLSQGFHISHTDWSW